jgi:riboflavin kinase/FMN adenylyltransferase
MNVIQTASMLAPGDRPVCAAIGVFDGVHLGHQHVIQDTLNKAASRGGLATIITFDRHPAAILSPSHAPPLIYPLAKRLEVLASLGAATAYVIHFDKTFSQCPAERFIRELARDFKNLRHISVGRDFTFGRDRHGNVPLMETLGRELGFTVHGLPHCLNAGHPVSSTRIREAIQSGNLQLASQMLGRPYSLSGPVVEGDHIGHKLGSPTANLDTRGLALPPTGVYAVRATVNGSTHQAVLNMGHRPTLKFPTPRLQVEVHLLDFDRNIYGENLEMVFHAKLRDEQRFPSLDALTAQIQKDIALARSLFQHPATPRGRL